MANLEALLLRLHQDPAADLHLLRMRDLLDRLALKTTLSPLSSLSWTPLFWRWWLRLGWMCLDRCC